MERMLFAVNFPEFPVLPRPIRIVKALPVKFVRGKKTRKKARRK